jgi:uncharacterized membrane protein YdjX (TVP38/TMEM64 family)
MTLIGAGRIMVSATWLIGGLLVLLWLFSTGGERIGDIARTHGLLGLAAGYGLVVISQIAAPLSGFAVVVGMAKIYGLPSAMAVLYLAYLTTFAVNFALARAFGQPLVLAVLGAAQLTKLRDAAMQPQLRYVAVSRILGYYYNDAISYIWGLTGIDFRRYYLTSIAATVIPASIEYWVISHIPLTDARALLIFYGALFALSGSFLGVWALYRRHSLKVAPRA